MSTLQIHGTWRIYVAMMISQIPAAAVGALVAPTGDRIIDLWYGAALGLPVGFLVGLLWQLHSAPKAVMQHRWHVVALGMFAIALPAVGVLTFDTWTKVAASS